MNMIKASALAVLIAATSACTIVPGSSMNSFNSRWFDDTPENYTPATTNTNFIPINATLLSHLNIEQPRTIPPSNGLKQLLMAYEYRIGPGDVLTITVWEHPELTIPAGSYRTASEGGNEVKADGSVFYPYAGDLPVAGLTTNEVKSLLENKLSSVIKNPQIDVRVASFNSQKVYVSGSVMQPGIIPITTTPLTLIDAITTLGGLSNDASPDNITLTRNDISSNISLKSLYQEGRWAQNILLQNGDLIHISRNDAEKIFVLGEVRSPSGLVMPQTGISLAEALAEAKGIDENRADGRGIYVLRNMGVTNGADGLPVYNATIYHLNASSAVGFMLADKFPLEARDVVYVSAAPIARWNRFLSQLLPSISVSDRIGTN
ncbi:polysaccharide export protein [Zhongshania sp.]|jgi:polysaccharide export outer membrane protein|uniref:polysaccharide export protein n=1 Tax=Zhongshania sp. TaxID=1971902 RepID=UPI0039E32535